MKQYNFISKYELKNSIAMFLFCLSIGLLMDLCFYIFAFMLLGEAITSGGFYNRTISSFQNFTKILRKLLFYLRLMYCFVKNEKSV